MSGLRSFTCFAWGAALFVAVPAAALKEDRVKPSHASLAHHDSTVSLADRLPWYTSGEALHRRAGELARSCKQATLSLSDITSPDGGVSLDTVHIRRDSPSNTKKTKAVLFFGIHSRELISTESGLHFMQTLCGTGPASARANSLLDQVDFVIVPNANPLGRKEVDRGNFCKRTNEHDVDLNRNWGFDGHMDPESKDKDTNPGPHSFSEPESRLLQHFVAQEKPDIFLDVHSGSYLLGTPWAYSPQAYPKDQAMLLEVLKPISDKYCDGQCPYGNAADLVGYPAPGTEMDYLKDRVGTPYSFSWEIYVGDRYREYFIDKARKQREAHGGEAMSKSFSSMLLEEDAYKVGESLVDATQDVNRAQAEASRLRGAAALLQIDENATASTQPQRLLSSRRNEACLMQFAPMTEKETREVVENWSDAYLDLCERVLAHKSRDS
eukprot:TRINITY_DN10385_c1_g1_i1.p1 TRINITY_DN10385_c1_g1~~TRINITY_DN10385_c1_g1_i1.p1  ORF type:complete len:438 (+),score=83.76 TRINITY_DN10385_c1_g1_i1:79-1392(+)